MALLTAMFRACSNPSTTSACRTEVTSLSRRYAALFAARSTAALSPGSADTTVARSAAELPGSCATSTTRNATAGSGGRAATARAISVALSLLCAIGTLRNAVVAPIIGADVPLPERRVPMRCVLLHPLHDLREHRPQLLANDHLGVFVVGRLLRVQDHQLRARSQRHHRQTRRRVHPKRRPYREEEIAARRRPLRPFQHLGD